MKKQSTKVIQTYLVIVAILAWLGLAIQFYIIITNRTVSIPETIVRYLSYFTILTNILVALYCTFVLLKPDSRWGKYFSRPNVVGAITVYIAVVGITYNTVLRHLWNPHGLEMVGDELTHLVTPALFLLYWLIFLPKEELKWKDAFPWLIYPLVYFAWVIIFGALSGFYPYYFINVNDLGYSKVLLNSSMLTIVFLLFSLLFIAIGKFMKSKIK
jgi:hypothetical protein